jgi:hypothetical protein
MHALVLIMSPFHHNPTANGSRFFSEVAVSDRRVALLFFQNFADGFRLKRFFPKARLIRMDEDVR